MPEMRWNVEEGLHYATSDELYIEAAKLIKKAEMYRGRKNRKENSYLIAKAQRLVKEARRIEQEELEDA